MRAAFAEALCLDPDSVLIADDPAAFERSKTTARIAAKLARLSDQHLASIETIVDRIIKTEPGNG